MLSASLAVYGQSAVDASQFFLDQAPLSVTLSTDIGNLVSGKIKDNNQKAIFTCKLPDSSTVSEEILINARGHMRRSICYMPPLKLNFRNASSPKLYPLNSLKLVCACRGGDDYQQLLLKEYLVYKMYNLLTEKSFRVRLLNITYEDTKEKKNPGIQYAFFVENIDALAKRNRCKEWKGVKLHTETTDRELMTMLAIFEYMIGNTDWSVPGDHNVKLIVSKKDSTTRPFAIPYDFDYSGIVNAEYAVPEPQLGIENVTQRLYRGYPRNMEELNAVLAVYNLQKENIYAVINECEPLSNQYKKQMIHYLDDFYKTINDPVMVKHTFINDARQQ
ncbi:hypothetical protein BH10BAC2_BH10BAC2_42230 [soil metagenome]